jgi:trigger factor
MNHEKPEAENEPASRTEPQENPLIRRFQVAMNQEEIDREIDRLAEQYSRKMTMPGFRQGKVPVEVVKKVHQQALREEVVQEAVKKLAFAHIEKERMDVADAPYVEKMDDLGNEGFRADIAVEILPEIELPDLAGLKVEIQAAALKEETFDEAKHIDRVLEANKRSLPVRNRAVAENDLVALLVQSLDVASKRKWPRQETYFVMNRENPSEIAGLFDALLGKSAGEKFTIQSSYPADAAKKAWADKEIEHQVEVKAIYEFKKPELDDDFLKSLGLKSIEEFKAKLKDEYEHQQNHRRQEALLEGIYEKLLNSVSFPVPRALQEHEVARRLAENRQQLNFKDEEEKARFKEMLLAQAEKSVRLSLILEKIRTNFQITADDADLDKEYAHLAKHHNLPEKEIRKYYGERERIEELKNRVLQEKIDSFIREKIEIKEV